MKKYLFTILTAVIFGIIPRVPAATLTVTKTGDTNDGICDTDCGLREAIAAASSGDTIDIPAGVYTLTSASQLVIDKNLTLNGERANTTIIQAADSSATAKSRVILVNSGVNANIAGVTIRHGSGNNRNGAGIRNAGTLNLTESAVRDNSGSFAAGGPDIFDGAGIYNEGMLTLTRSLVTNNRGRNGGIHNTGTAHIMSSTISQNTASNINGFGTGGGIYNSGSLTAVNSTISGNTSIGSGGGIYNSGPLTVVNSTISGNTSIGSGGGGVALDRTLYGSNATAIFLNSTITGNAAKEGGGVASYSRSVQVTNTIIAGNVAPTGPDCFGNLIVSHGHNLIGDTSGCSTAAASGDLFGTALIPIDPLLDPLEDNGGLNVTHALRPCSPAVDAGDDSQAPAVDQRNVNRPVDGDGDGVAISDIGAYEFDPSQGDNPRLALDQRLVIKSAMPTVIQLTRCALGAEGGVSFIVTALPSNGRLYDGATQLSSVPYVLSSDLVTYIPDTAFFGPDNFGFRFSNGTTESNTAAINVTVVSPGGITITVNKTGDTDDGICSSTDCSLREAVERAGDGDIIAVPAGTYSLSLGRTLTIDKNLTLVGNSANNTIIQGFVNPPEPDIPLGTVEFYVFDVAAGNVSIAQITIQHGAASSISDGGGVRNQGTLALSHCVLRANTGGIYNTGVLTITNSVVRDSHEAGIWNEGAVVTILGSSVVGNSGPGVYNEGTLNLANSAISSNGGGGIYNKFSTGIVNATGVVSDANDSVGIYNYTGTVIFTNSTISNNTGVEGGGIENRGDLILINCTVSGNSAIELGGGIFNSGGAAILGNVTVTNNTAAQAGGIYHTTNELELINTIVAGNFAAETSPDCNAFTSLGHNLIGDTSGCVFTPAAGDLLNVDPKISPLMYNGGATFTHLLLANSPAINAGDNGAAPPTDQRGIVRPQGTRSDIGAYEFQPGVNMIPGAFDTSVATLGTKPISIVLDAFDGDAGSGLQFVILSLPSNGQLIEGPNSAGDDVISVPHVLGSKVVTYIAQVGFHGIDKFTFKAFDGEAESNMATVTVDVRHLLIVTKTADSNDGICDADCSIREAIASIDSGGTIDIPTGIYTLTLGTQLTINKDLTLTGGGADSTIIQAAAQPGLAAARVLGIDSGNDVAIAGMTVRHGLGGISNRGTLTLSEVVIRDNNGGGIENAGTLTVTDSTVSGNSTSGSGGAILNSVGILKLNNCTVTGNTAREGGGIANTNNGAKLIITGSTISGNSAVADGGGIWNSNGTVSLTNVTITNNQTSANGGGIHQTGTLTVTNSTLAHNTAAVAGGGIFHESGTTTLFNSIIAHNHADNGSPDCNRFTSHGHNLIGDTSGCIFDTAVGDLVNVDPMLGPLQYAGGPTLVHVLLFGSPAIDAGANSNALATDQRGVARPQNAHSDIGAYEFQPGVNTLPAAFERMIRFPQETSAVITLTGFDADIGNTLRYIITSLPENGHLFEGDSITGEMISSVPRALAADKVTYKANEGNVNNNDRFTFKVNDGEADSNIAIITLDIVRTLTVTKTNDTNDGVCDADCSLREAITAATPGDVINVPIGIYTLTVGSELTIDKDLTLTGAGPANTIIEAATQPDIANFRVFNVTGGSVVISGVTVRHGKGGIQNSGTLSLINSIIEGNSAGGVVNYGGTLTIDNSKVTGNKAVSEGGGAYIAGGAVTITTTTISDNSAVYGAGVSLSNGKLTLINSTITGNSAVQGGGIDSGGTLSLINCTISGNRTKSSGSGIRNSGILALANCTIAANTSNSDGRGLYHWGGGTATLINTVIAGNIPARDCYGEITSLGHNLIGDTSDCDITPAVGDLIDVDARLGPLQNAGGPTKTHVLLRGSPAIDAGHDSGAPATDQRGVVRPQGEHVDIGAYESQPVNTLPAAFDDIIITPEDTPVVIILEGFDAETSNVLTFIIASLPENGTLFDGADVTGDMIASTQYVLAGDTVTYRPQDGFGNSDESFTFTVNDGEQDSSPATITVDIRHTMPVTKTADTNDGVCNQDCSLREAVAAAKSGDRISIPAGVYTLTLGSEFRISRDLTVLGAGAESTFVEAAAKPGAANWRVFNIIAGNVKIQDVTIRNGKTQSDYGGGGILNGSTLTLIDSVVTGNTAGMPVIGGGGHGGGIYNVRSTLTVINTIISSNSAASGGGIYNYSPDVGTITVTDSAVSANTASYGGGIYNASGEATVTSSIISGNSAVNGGGGIYNHGWLTLDNSSISGNTGSSGGGLLFNAGKLTLTNSIISYNLADSGGGLVINNGIGGVTLTDSVISGNYATQNGGGIHNTGRRGFTMINGAVSNNTAAVGGGLYTRGDVVLTNSTVNGNIASEGGGIRKAGGNLILRSTIVAGNTATRGPDCGGVTFLGSVGYNLIEDPSDCIFSPAASDLVNVIPLLTVDGHLRIQSPAIDAATGVEAPDGDRDHEDRPDGVNVDIGADEYVDSDEDGLPDWLEQQVVGDDASLDPGLDDDQDGLKNIEEYELSANPANPDSDLDGTWDGEEVVRNSEQHELNRISDPREPDTLLAPFNAFSQFATADPPVSQVVLHSVLADVDADDDIDLICARATGQLVYFENSGSAVSPHWESYSVIGACPRHFAVGDADGDSDLDVMILTARNLIFIRNEYQEDHETTTWALPEAIGITLDDTLGSRVYLADVVNKLGAPEKDGLSDIVIAAFDGRMTLIRNNGSTGGARWQSPDPDWAGTTVFSPSFTTLGDIDLDGDLDRFVGLDADDKPVFQQNIDDHLLMFPRTVTIAQGDEQIIEVTVDDNGAADMTALHVTIAQNTSNGTIAPVGGHAWRYVAGTTGVGIDVIKGTLEQNDGSRLNGLVVVNVISKAEADLVGKALIVVGKRSDNDPLYSISERLAVYAYVVCRQQGYATENIRLLTPDGKLSSGDVRIGSTAHLGWNVAAFGENSLLESIIKGPWAGSADDLLLYFVDHGVVDAGVGQLLLSPSFRVSSTELNQWLNLWQTVDKKATVIIDTCYSGRFVSELQSPPHPDRIILAAAQPGQLAHFQAGGVISFSQFFWDELSAGATLGSAYLQARNGLEKLRQLPTLDFTGDGIADDEQVTQTESIRQFGNPALLSGVQRPLIRNVMNDTTAESGLATLWVNGSEIISNHGVERVFAYIAPPTLETDVDNGSAIVGMDHVELTDFIARRHIDDADFDYWQTLPGQPDPDDPTQLFLSPEDKALLSASYVNASDGHYALRPNVNVANKQNLRRIEERLGYPPRYEADWTEFDISGDYQIVFFVQDRWGMLSPAKVAMVTVAGPISKAIVVECAGTTGVASPGDPARIHSHGSLVERNLRLRSFTSDTIRWFGANHLPPQKSEIGSSITAWAQDAVHLTLYFVGNAASAGLVLENNDIIAPLEIKAWLDQFQATSGGNVTVIIDANFAGQFATALAGSGDTRQVICSTGKASQNLRHAGADFTRWLWNGLARDASIQQAFADTLAFARAAGIDPSFTLDDNGDGVYTPKQDGIVSRALFIGQSLPTGEGELTIGAVNEALVVEAGGTARLWAAEILVPDGSTPTVWAELLPPGYAVGDPVARIDLSLNPVTNRYEGEHQFLAGVAAGRHVALIQAVSSANLDHTSLPAPVEIYYQIPIPPGTRTAPIDIPRIVPGAAMQATTLSENPDENWFRLWAAKGKRFTIDLGPGTDSAAADLVLRICDRPDVDALSVIEADDWGAGFAERIWNWQPADTGWYYVHVEEYDAAGRSDLAGERRSEHPLAILSAVQTSPGSRAGARSYILRITREQSAGADGYEADYVPELARFMSLRDGEFQSHNFHQAGDEDWIAFRLLQGYSYTIKVYDWGVNSEPILEWYDGDELAHPIRCITTSSASAEAAADCEQAHTANREINLDTGLIFKTGTYYVKVRNATPAFGLGADYKIMNFDTVGPQVPADIFGLLKVKDDPQNRLIPGIVTIDIFDGAHTERTRWCCGEYTTTLAPQTTDYTLTAMADGYQSQVKTVHVSSGAEIALDFELTPLSTIAHTITVVAENGRVDNLHNPYSPGSEALLIPSPDIHHEFSHWSGVAINSGNATAAPLRFTITDHVSLTAHFAPKQYSLEIENSSTCENCGTPLPSGQYDPGDLAAWSVVTPWPSEAGESGVRFVAEIPSGNALMDRDRVITLDWIRQYYLTVQTQGQGTVSKTSGWRNADEVVRINAVGQGTHRFANWLADGKAVAGNPLNVAMDRAKEIAAEFIPVTSLDIDGNGGVGVPTDGILIMRYLFGFTSPALTDGIVGPGGGRSDSEILVYLVSARANGVFDIDGNGREDALTDGVMILRHLAGEGAGSVSNSAVDSSNCVRCDGAVIKQFLNALTP